MSAEQDIVLSGVSQSLIDPLAASDAYIWKKYLAAEYIAIIVQQIWFPLKNLNSLSTRRYVWRHKLF